MNNEPGLRFRKLDLHTHTPASECYKHDHTPEEIIETALNKGLDAIAVTDHNTATWIDKMKAAADIVQVQEKKLIIFPGVEISTHEGYHVIALFDPSAGQAEIENFLGAIDITPDFYGRSDALCPKSVYEVFKIIHERGGLSILAHIDETKGAFHELSSLETETGRIRIPVICSRLFNEGVYDAVEVTQANLPDAFDERHGIHCKPAFYHASDSLDPEDPIHHSKDGIGQRCSWFKLDEITLEGLRQCFADPEVRITLRDPQSGIWPHIKEIRIGNQGFLAYQRFKFHPGLNCIIGGKGVGKSLVVEFLRFVLGQPSQQNELYKDHIGKLEKQLKPSNYIEIDFELKSGINYTIKRIYEGKGRDTIECINLSTGEHYNGDISQLFPILAYSQTEVIEIAKDENAQLRLIDSLVDVHSYQQNIEKLQEQLIENDGSIATALGARTKAEDIYQEIATLGERITNIEAMLSNPLLGEMRKAERRNEVFREQLRYVDDLMAAQTRHETEIREFIPPTLPEEFSEDDELKTKILNIKDVQEKYLATLATIPPIFNTIRASILDAKMRWDIQFQALKHQYQQTLQGNDQARLEAERSLLLQQKHQAERSWERYRKLAYEDLPILQTQRNELLNLLDEQYHQYYEVRKNKFDYIAESSEGRLQLILTHATNIDAYTDALVNLWSGSDTSTITAPNRRKIAKAVSPRKLGEIIMTRNVEQLAEASGLSLNMAERAMDKLWAYDNFAEVLKIQHKYYPEDTPTIKFDKGNSEFAALDELSVGQKCTALLIIALCDGILPVIMDQPEDALDIASVWHDVAKKLRRGKYGRQFILTTHNSSLAVGSDSDNFTVLIAHSGDRAKVSARGAIDRLNVRAAIIDHLEGGDEPYKLRQRKYNIV